MWKILKAVHRPIIVLSVFALLSTIHWIFYPGVVVLTIDVLARYQDFRDLEGSRFTRRKARILQGSWCSRGVSQALWGWQARRYYYSRGYRWYHILPDGAPSVFLKRDFWKSVVGLK